MVSLHPAFDWQKVARIVLTSRRIDELEETELAPQGHVTYQFSAGGRLGPGHPLPDGGLRRTGARR